MFLRRCPTPGRSSDLRRVAPSLLRYCGGSNCSIHIDGRNRTSNAWMPTRIPSAKDRSFAAKNASQREKEDTTELLSRAGFLRRAYSGIFHMLPLGLRVQEKIERLIDKHMRSLGASKVSLSSISSLPLWGLTGRLNDDSDIFRLKDRKGTSLLLAPTHEEEITRLVGSLSSSYKHLPVRVYQISRKYRDEPRPRYGLLRGREFVMKDLYTFDNTVEDAMKTYDVVRSAYTRIFDELKLPYLIAEADSGNMGGNLSHEFVLPSPQGEDRIVSCSNCGLVYNEEVFDGKSSEHESSIPPPTSNFATGDAQTGASPTISNSLWMGISKDKRTLLRAWYPKYVMSTSDKEPVEREANSHAIKLIAKESGIVLDTGVENPLQQWADRIKTDRASKSTPEQRPRVLDLYDSQVRVFKRPPLGDLAEYADCAEDNIEYGMVDRFPGTSNGLKLARTHDGEQCPKCAERSLVVYPAVELGHTFHLGTRYTETLNAKVIGPEVSGENHVSGEKSKSTPMQMGCHGIGVSRMITAVADVLTDKKGLNWPRVIAPYEVVIISMAGQAEEAEKVYDLLASDQPSMDVILDDRNKRPPWLLTDADLIGYPVIVVVGKAWRERQMVEVQCRQLNDLKEEVPVDRLAGFVQSLLAKL